jgi:hypothetical protein
VPIGDYFTVQLRSYYADPIATYHVKSYAVYGRVTPVTLSGCNGLDSWDGNRCFMRVTDFNGVTIEKSNTMYGSDGKWIDAFSSDEYTATVHMDSASVGHYLAMTFPSEMMFNGFRFECGGNGY